MVASFRRNDTVARVRRPRTVASRRAPTTDTDIAGYRNPPRPIARLLPASSLKAPERLIESVIRRGDSVNTRRAYRGDLETYAAWLDEAGFAWDAVSIDDLDEYRDWLSSRYARSTTNRRLSIVRSLYAEALRRGAVEVSPALMLRGIRGRDESEGGALTLEQSRGLLASIRAHLDEPIHALLARRDLALVSILLRTGLRRSELVSLRIGSMGTAQGHNVLTIRGKGNVTRTVKVPTDVQLLIDGWLEAATSAGAVLTAEEPLFFEVRRGGRIGTLRPLSDRSIYLIVTRHMHEAGIEGLGPHALRGTFVTLALEGGAPLHIVQRAAGHADPRTTERYWRRKDSLDTKRDRLHQAVISPTIPSARRRRNADDGDLDGGGWGTEARDHAHDRSPERGDGPPLPPLGSVFTESASSDLSRL